MKDFSPTFCPNPSCQYHLKNSGPLKVHRCGYFRSKLLNGRQLARFKCVACRKSFSQITYSLDHINRRRRLSPLIFSLFTQGLSNRQIARNLSCSPHLVLRRLKILSQQGMLFRAEREKHLLTREDYAYDGLENFARSQYEPNHINHLIGRESLFIYDFNFAPLNRKGFMSERQKVINLSMQTVMGKLPRGAILRASKRLFLRKTRELAPGKTITIYTDEHLQYERAIRFINRTGLKIQHETVSSKAPRTYKNVLFSVNHCDLLTRHHIKAFMRETIAFSKTPGAMVQKYSLFALWKNYFRPRFTKRHAHDPLAHINTPAQAIGLAKAPLRFGEVFSGRPFRKRIHLNRDWTLFYAGRVPHGRSRRDYPRNGPQMQSEERGGS